MAAKHLHDRVLVDSVSGAGIGRGSIVTIEESEEAVRQITTGDVCFVELRPDEDAAPSLALRQYVSDHLFVTNRLRGNTAVRRDNPDVCLRVRGVAVRRRTNQRVGALTAPTVEVGGT